MAKNSSKKKKTTSTDSDFSRLNGFLLNANEDVPDFRDFSYQPSLIRLERQIDYPKNLNILDQGREGACTGFGLAAVINRLLADRSEDRTVSPRMLYEMARRFDEWEGESYIGSSCRGAIRGWHSMGVCSNELAPYKTSERDWNLNIDQAKDARSTTLGAYYRVAPKLSDYHAALNEVSVLYASARVHEGWDLKHVKDGKIPFGSFDKLGGHAFAIVGYNDKGFWIQNSWGKKWGKSGIALWSYEDWLENVQDAWVVRLGLSTPQVWHLMPTTSSKRSKEEGIFTKNPKRAELVGHFVHIDDGKFDDKGKYWTDLATIQETAEFVASSEKYDHILLYAHGGLNSINASARRIVAMKETFKDNRIYPFHFMYDTGLLEEVKDIVLGKKAGVEGRAGGFTDFTDRLVEKATRHAGRAIWREMKRGARRPFESNGAGTQTISAFLKAFTSEGATKKHMHLAGHSTGAILLASLCEAFEQFPNAPRVDNCLLMAPACTHDTFNDVYRRLLSIREKEAFGIDRMVIYNLEDKLERDDTVTPLYRKSLLYLVSNAFEEDRGERILGMQKFSRFLRNLPGSPVFRFDVSDGSGSKKKPASKQHGDFDNDVNTMNDLLFRILQKKPARPFTAKDLEY